METGILGPDDRVELLPLRVRPLEGGRTGYPARVAGGGCDAAIEGGGELHHHRRQAGPPLLQVPLEEPRAGGGAVADLDADAGLAQPVVSGAVHLRVRILDRGVHLGDAGGAQQGGAALERVRSLDPQFQHGEIRIGRTYLQMGQRQQADACRPDQAGFRLQEVAVGVDRLGAKKDLKVAEQMPDHEAKQGQGVVATRYERERKSFR